MCTTLPRILALMTGWAVSVPYVRPAVPAEDAAAAAAVATTAVWRGAFGGPVSDALARARFVASPYIAGKGSVGFRPGSFNPGQIYSLRSVLFWFVSVLCFCWHKFACASTGLSRIGRSSPKVPTISGTWSLNFVYSSRHWPGVGWLPNGSTAVQSAWPSPAAGR